MSRLQPVALLVEDDELVSLSIRSLLERNQIQVVLATDGQQALDLVDRTEFDIVLLDLMLPQVNGFQFLRALRHTDRDTGISPTAVREISDYWEQVRAQYVAFESGLAAPASEAGLFDGVREAG